MDHHYILKGLENFGNTCFINATIQALFASPAFATWLTDDEIAEEIVDNIFVNKYEFKTTLFNLYNSLKLKVDDKITTTCLVEFHQKCKKEINFIKNSSRNDESFGLSEQQDAEEFLTQMFRILNTEIHTIISPSPKEHQRIDLVIENKTSLQKLYVYRTTHTRRCINNHSYVTVKDIENGLVMIDLENESSDFKTLVGEFASWKKMVSNVICDVCQKSQITFEQTLLIDSPTILIIFLKRFEFVKFDQNNVAIYKKNEKTIHLVLRNLDIDRVYEKPTRYIYDLYSVIVRIGCNISFGHYKAYCRKNQHDWYCYNDSEVNQVNINDQNIYNELSKSSYILFYERKQCEINVINAEPNSKLIKITPSPVILQPECMNMIFEDDDNSNLSVTDKIKKLNVKITSQAIDENVFIDNNMGEESRDVYKGNNNDDFEIEKAECISENEEQENDYFVRVLNSGSKATKIYFNYEIDNKAVSGHLTTNNILEKEVFPHKWLTESTDLWPDFDALKPIIENKYSLTQGEIKEVASFSFKRTRIYYLVNDSTHYYLLRRFEDGDCIWLIDPTQSFPTTINTDFLLKLSKNNPKFTQIYQLDLKKSELENFDSKSLEINEEQINEEIRTYNMISSQANYTAESVESSESDNDSSSEEESTDLDLKKRNEEAKPILEKGKSHFIVSFEQFCKRMSFPIFPATVKIIITFFTWLAFGIGYTTGYIRLYRFAIQDYYRLNNYKLSSNEISQLAKAMLFIKKQHPNKKQGFGKSPCIYEDLERILQSIPDEYPNRLLISALSLLTFYSSQRKCSVLSVRFKDVIVHKFKDQNLIKSIRVHMDVTKGKRECANITKLFERKENHKMCFINALENYMKYEHKIDLNELNNETFSYEQKERKIFNITGKKFTEMFSYISYQAGYQSKMFTPHSLRSGAVCTMLINASKNKSNGNTFNHAFMQSRNLGEWATNSTSHKVYVKKMEIGTLVASRFVDPDNNLPLAEETLISSEIFHNLSTPIVSRWNTTAILYEKLYDEVKNEFLTIFKKNNYEIDETEMSLVNSDFESVFLNLLHDYCKKFENNTYENWLNTKEKNTLSKINYISSRTKYEIIYLLLENKNYIKLVDIFKNLMIEFDKEYCSTNDWTNEEDLAFFESLEKQNFKILYAETCIKRRFYEKFKRYQFLVSKYGSNFEKIIESCKNISTNFNEWDPNNDYTSKANQKWTKQEYKFLKKCVDENMKMTKMNSFMGLKGRSYFSIKKAIYKCEKNEWVEVNEKEESLIQICNQDHTSKAKQKWEDEEIDDLLRYYYVCGKTAKEILFLLPGRQLGAIQNKIKRTLRPENLIQLMNSKRWNRTDLDELEKMKAEKNDWTNEEIKTRLGRTVSAFEQKWKEINIKKDKKDISKEKTGFFQRNNIKSKLKNSSLFYSKYIGSFGTDKLNSIEEAVRKLCIWEKVYRPMSSVITSCTSEEIYILFDEKITKKIEIKKVEIDSLITFKYQNDKLVLLIKQKIGFKIPIIHLLTEVDSNMLNQLKINFFDDFKIASDYLEEDIDDVRIELIKDLKCLLEAIKNASKIKNDNIQTFLQIFRRLINMLVEKKEYIDDLETCLKYFKELNSELETNKVYKKELRNAYYPYLNDNAIDYLKSNISLKFLFEIDDSDAWVMSEEDVEFAYLWDPKPDVILNSKSLAIKALEYTYIDDLQMYETFKSKTKLSDKEKWALKEYENFIEDENEMKNLENDLNKEKNDSENLKLIIAWPINIEILQEFMKAMSKRYAAGTIRNMVSFLNNIQRFYGQDEFSKNDFKKINVTLDECKCYRNVLCNKKGLKLEGKGKAPAFHLILFHILNLVPHDYPDREFYISMHLFMLNTGQRYMTMCNIKLDDIVRVVRLVNNKVIVTIIARITKGSSQFNQPFNIEGDLENESIMNCIYWTNKCLQQHHNLDLRNFEDWKNNNKTDYLWGSKTKNYKKQISYSLAYKKFRLFYENAGIPSKQLGLHSMRSGFFCQSYLNCFATIVSIDLVKEFTMVLAGWRHPRDMEIYNKDEMKSLVTIDGVISDLTPEEMLGYNGLFVNRWIYHEISA